MNNMAPVIPSIVKDLLPPVIPRTANRTHHGVSLHVVRYPA